MGEWRAHFPCVPNTCASLHTQIHMTCSGKLGTSVSSPRNAAEILQQYSPQSDRIDRRTYVVLGACAGHRCVCHSATSPEIQPHNPYMCIGELKCYG